MERGLGIRGCQIWEGLLSFGKLSGNLGEWDCGYDRRSLLGEIVEKRLSRDVLEGFVVLVLEVVVTGDTGLKSQMSHTRDT